MYSDVGKNDWNWVSWREYNDAHSNNTHDGTFWKPVQVSEDRFALEDKDGNILRVTRYGTHWGVPYAVKPTYLPKDTGKSPTSEFLADNSMQDWMRFIYANIGKNLQTCPASHIQTRTLKQNPFFPPNFTPSVEWVRRLYDISQTTTGGRVSSGACGVCLLHSYQIIAELLENPYQPRTSGGYF